MVIERRTHIVQQGKMAEAIGMLKEANSKSNNPRARVLTPVVGTYGTLLWEGEFESVAARQAFWENWVARPETAAFLEHWYTLTENTVHTELLQVVESINSTSPAGQHSSAGTIITRLIFTVQQGKQAEAIKALIEDGKHGGPPARIMTLVAGAFNTLVWEGEFESMAAQQAFSENWSARPSTPAFMEHWATLVENRGGSELLRVE